MADLFELRERPDLDEPVLVVALDGWIDAGYAAAAARESIRAETELHVLATFDTDLLLDYRSRRPTMHLADGVNTGLTWPAIELCSAVDRNGHDALLLVGAEPDHSWKAFSTAVVDLALELGVRLVTGLGAYPAPTPHTRPTRVVTTATDRSLARLVGYVPGRIDVPSGISGAIERQADQVGLPAAGLWAQVPHYASAMPYPGAAAALLDGLEMLAGLRFDAAPLLREAAATRARLDELVAGSAEHLELVRQLEAQSDAGPADDGPIRPVSGDELAAELERFLRDQGKG